MLRETEFFIQECYKVTIDESAIDQYMDRVNGFTPDEIARERAKFHRLFQAIATNEEALQAAIEYEALAQHAAESGTGYGHLKGNYGDVADDDYGFHMILTQFAHIFTQEDKEWWLELIKRHEDFISAHGKEEEYWKHEDYFDLDNQIKALDDCFQAEYSSWDAYEHLCARKLKENN